MHDSGYVCTDEESIRELAPILGQLNAKYGVFAILGNYDCWRQPDLIRAQLAAQSIEVLLNRGLHVGPSAGRLFLAGLGSVWRGMPDPIRAFANYREGNVALAVVHEPYGSAHSDRLTAFRSQPRRADPDPGTRTGGPAALGSDLSYGPLRTKRALRLHRARPGHGGITVTV